MNTLPISITERVDDIPRLLEQRQRMGLPTLFDTHFPTQGNWTGLSLGWVSTIWLSAILGVSHLLHMTLLGLCSSLCHPCFVKPAPSCESACSPSYRRLVLFLADM